MFSGNVPSCRANSRAWWEEPRRGRCREGKCRREREKPENLACFCNGLNAKCVCSFFSPLRHPKVYTQCTCFELRGLFLCRFDGLKAKPVCFLNCSSPGSSRNASRTVFRMCVCCEVPALADLADLADWEETPSSVMKYHSTLLVNRKSLTNSWKSKYFQRIIKCINHALT